MNLTTTEIIFIPLGLGSILAAISLGLFFAIYEKGRFAKFWSRASFENQDSQALEIVLKHDFSRHWKEASGRLLLLTNIEVKGRQLIFKVSNDYDKTLKLELMCPACLREKAMDFLIPFSTVKYEWSHSQCSEGHYLPCSYNFEAQQIPLEEKLSQALILCDVNPVNSYLVATEVAQWLQELGVWEDIRSNGEAKALVKKLRPLRRVVFSPKTEGCTHG